MKINRKRGFNIGLGSKFRSLPNYLVIGLIVMLIFSLLGDIKRVRKAEKLISERQNNLEKLENEQVELKVRLEEVQSEEYIEKQIRDNLNLAKEGEIVVVLPPDDVLRKLAPKIEEEEVTLPDPNWKKWLQLFI